MLETGRSQTVEKTRDNGADSAQPRDPLAKLRPLLLALLIFAITGTASELVLLEHYEDPWQWTPLVLLIAGLIITIVMAVRPGRRRVRVFQGSMILFIVAGLLGLFLHYRGNAEFELEMVPSLHGFQLFWEAIRGATPALAPGTMVQLGLLGLACTWRHPSLQRSAVTAAHDSH